MDFEITDLGIAAVSSAIQKAVRRAEREIADSTAEKIRCSFRKPKSGRTYKRKPRGSYRASAPGEPPANVTTTLSESVGAVYLDDGAEIVVTDEMAHTMEFGTAGGKIAARPFLAPEVDEMTRTLPEAIADAVRSGVG